MSQPPPAVVSSFHSADTLATVRADVSNSQGPSDAASAPLSSPGVIIPSDGRSIRANGLEVSVNLVVGEAFGAATILPQTITATARASPGTFDYMATEITRLREDIARLTTECARLTMENSRLVVEVNRLQAPSRTAMSTTTATPTNSTTMSSTGTSTDSKPETQTKALQEWYTTFISWRRSLDCCSINKGWSQSAEDRFKQEEQKLASLIMDIPMALRAPFHKWEEQFRVFRAPTGFYVGGIWTQSCENEMKKHENTLEQLIKNLKS